MSEFRHLFGGPPYQAFVRVVLREGGVTAPHSPLDRNGATDPYELAAQKARRDFALQLVELMGWTVDAVPPEPPGARQRVAESDGGGPGEQAERHSG